MEKQRLMKLSKEQLADLVVLYNEVATRITGKVTIAFHGIVGGLGDITEDDILQLNIARNVVSSAVITKEIDDMNEAMELWGKE